MDVSKMVKWQWSSYNDLSKEDLYEILRVRQEVFVVEQDCAYQDVDNKDPFAWHLLGWNEGKIIAYLRVVFPQKKYNEPSIGRVLTALKFRRSGLGKELMYKAISHIEIEYPRQGNRISAQQHLEKFYNEFGFYTVSEPYDEDGIPHVEMLKNDTLTDI